jgi:hypothetical protein
MWSHFNLRRMLLIFLLLFSMMVMPSAHADDCIEKACINVYTENGRIVIEGRKGSGAVASARPRPVVTRKPATPKPRTSRTAVSRPRTSSPKPRRTVAKKATSLQDKLIESLPTGGISYQPSYQPLVATPVYLWADIPTVVKKKFSIVGEIVEVELHPLFFWHYGDGTVFITRKAGTAFPDGEIRHTYSRPGHYAIELVTKWDGAFTIAGITKTIPGEITTVSVLPISVVSAPVRFKK